jgi:hypothetical protein
MGSAVPPGHGLGEGGHIAGRSRTTGAGPTGGRSRTAESGKRALILGERVLYHENRWRYVEPGEVIQKKVR